MVPVHLFICIGFSKEVISYYASLNKIVKKSFKNDGHFLDIDFLKDAKTTQKRTIFRQAKNPSLSAKTLCLQQLRAFTHTLPT